MATSSPQTAPANDDDDMLPSSAVFAEHVAKARAELLAHLKHQLCETMDEFFQNESSCAHGEMWFDMNNLPGTVHPYPEYIWRAMEAYVARRGYIHRRAKSSETWKRDDLLVISTPDI